jgi:hypothetical protein
LVLDIQSAQELSGLVKAWIDCQYQKEELTYKINPPAERDTTIRVEGGLPSLPGTSISMPDVINGHVADARALAAPTDVIPSTNQAQETTANEFSPADPNALEPGALKAQGAHPLQRHHFEPAPPELGEPEKNSTTNGGQEP